MRSGAMTSRHVTVTSVTGSRDRPTINVANDEYIARTTSNLIAVAWCAASASDLPPTQWRLLHVTTLRIQRLHLGVDSIALFCS